MPYPGRIDPAPNSVFPGTSEIRAVTAGDSAATAMAFTPAKGERRNQGRGVTLGRHSCSSLLGVRARRRLDGGPIDRGREGWIRRYAWPSSPDSVSRDTLFADHFLFIIEIFLSINVAKAEAMRLATMLRTQRIDLKQ